MDQVIMRKYCLIVSLGIVFATTGCNKIVDSFNITWTNYDGSVLKTSNVKKDELPVYDGETPTKPSTSEHAYVFNGWDPEIVPAVSDATYKATYQEVTFSDIKMDASIEDEENDIGFFYDGYLKVVDWGDGVTDQNTSHVYSANGEYEIKITGYFVNFKLYEFKEKHNGNKHITAVTLPPSITKINEDAFRLCEGLKTVTSTDDKIVAIDKFAFYECENLETITGISRLETIGQNAFTSSGIKNIELPETLKTIDEYAFATSGLTSVNIPSQIEIINNSAFQNCHDLETVTFSDNSKITVIDSGAFSNCDKLTNLALPNSITKIAGSAFNSCKKLNNVILPSELTYIGSTAFAICQELTSITIPSKVSFIGVKAFSGCYKLNSFTVNRDENSPVLVFEELYDEETSTTEGDQFAGSTIDSVNLTYPTTLSYAAFRGCKQLKSADIRGVTVLPAELFTDCEVLDSLTLSSNLTNIGNSAFKNCTSLPALGKLPNKLTKIGDYAFQNCENMTDVILPDYDSGKQLDIGTHAFDNTGISTIYLPDCINNFASGAFANCKDLKYVFCEPYQQPANWVNWDEGLDKDSIIWNVADYGTRPDGFKYIATKTDDPKKFNVIIYDYVGVSSSITLPQSWSGYKGTYYPYKIGKNFLKDNTTITSVTIPSNYHSIDESAFEGCSNLATVNFNDGLAIIGDSAFKGCSSLPAGIVFPSSIIAIGSNAFSGVNLATVYLTECERVVGIGRDTFETNSFTEDNSIFVNQDYLEEYKSDPNWEPYLSYFYEPEND